jgi:LAGLIDADG endonuclease
MTDPEQKTLFQSDRKIDPQDAAYIAGFFDGEGCINVIHSNRANGKGSFRLVLYFTNTHLPVLTWLREVIGTGSINPKWRKKPTHKSAWELKICARRNCRILLEAILPYSKIKRDRIELGLEFLKLGRIRKYNAMTRGKRWPVMRALPSEIDRRLEFKNKFAALNRRGQDASSKPETAQANGIGAPSSRESTS